MKSIALVDLFRKTLYTNLRIATLSSLRRELHWTERSEGARFGKYVLFTLSADGSFERQTQIHPNKLMRCVKKWDRAYVPETNRVKRYFHLRYSTILYSGTRTFWCEFWDVLHHNNFLGTTSTLQSFKDECLYTTIFVTNSRIWYMGV